MENNKVVQGFNQVGERFVWALNPVFGAYRPKCTETFVDVAGTRVHTVARPTDIAKVYKTYSDSVVLCIDYIDADIPTSPLAARAMAKYEAEKARLKAMLNPKDGFVLGDRYKAEIKAALGSLIKPEDNLYNHFIKWETETLDRIEFVEYPNFLSYSGTHKAKLDELMKSADYVTEMQQTTNPTYVANKYKRIAKQKALRSVLWYEPSVIILVTKDCGSYFNRAFIRDAITSGVDVQIECYRYGSFYINGVKGFYNNGNPRKDGRPHTFKSLSINQYIESDLFKKIEDCSYDLTLATIARDQAAFAMNCRVNSALSEYYLATAEDRKVERDIYFASEAEREFVEYLRVEIGYNMDPAKYASRTYTAERLNRAYIWAGALGISLATAKDKETFFHSYKPLRTEDMVLEKIRTVSLSYERPKKRGRISKKDKARYGNKLYTFKYTEAAPVPVVKPVYAGSNFNPAEETFSRTDLSYNQALALHCAYKDKYTTKLYDNLIDFDRKFRHIEYLRLEVLKAVANNDMETAELLMDSKWTVCEECGEPYRKTQWGCDNNECKNQQWVTVMCPDVWHCWEYQGKVPKGEMDAKGRIPKAIYDVLHKDLQKQVTAAATDKVGKTDTGIRTIASAELAE